MLLPGSSLLLQQHSGHVARGCPGYGPAHVGGLACRVVHVPVVRPHAAGMGNHSLGRVQTPTLALVCRRYLENRDFVPVSFYHLRTGVCKDGQKVLFTRPLRYERKEDAEKARAGLEGESRCTVLAVEKKENMEEPPLPHDLTGLQREANTRLGMAAGQTLAVVQRLYERGYVSYPRTGCRHIPEDIFEVSIR